MGSIICAKCGKTVSISEAKGSYKHPYCKECFTKVWHDDEKKYIWWLMVSHF
jgi:uncharacterized CHY-type Zn-finger protein